MFKGSFRCEVDFPLRPEPAPPPLFERLRWRLRGFWLTVWGRRPEYEECPWCYCYFDWFEDPYFRPEAAGVAFDGEVRTYWVEGEQRCPRCDGRWKVGDSS